MPKTTSIPTGAQSIKIRWLAGLLMAIFWASATAANNEDEDGARWYQVELILFTHNNPQALDAEQWPEIIGVDLPLEELVELQLPATAGQQRGDETGAGMAIEPPATDDPAGDAPTAPVAFRLLEESEWQLQKIAARLRRSSRFEPLLHVAWRQPTHDRPHARPVLLYDGMDKPLSSEELSAMAALDAGDGIDPGIDPGDSNETQDTFADPVYATAEDARIGPPNPRLIGTVKLSVARYLHLATDLVYRLPVTQQAAVPVPDFDLWYDRPYPTLREPQGPAYRLEEWQAIRGFRLRESRRMRSRVLHYLDHPLFGLVVLVTPVELPQADDQDGGVASGQ